MSEAKLLTVMIVEVDFRLYRQKRERSVDNGRCPSQEDVSVTASMPLNLTPSESE